MLKRTTNVPFQDQLVQSHEICLPQVGSSLD